MVLAIYKVLGYILSNALLDKCGLVMTHVAYCRVSSTDQNLDAQLAAVKTAGATKIFREKESGANEARPQLKACLDYLREGDELIVTRADRIARSSQHLLSTLNSLTEKGVRVRFIDQPQLNTGDKYAKFMLTVLAGVAELERELIRERAAQGIKEAKKRGRVAHAPRSTVAGSYPSSRPHPPKL